VRTDTHVALKVLYSTSEDTSGYDTYDTLTIILHSHSAFPRHALYDDQIRLRAKPLRLHVTQSHHSTI
jgi:hypothetical protein